MTNASAKLREAHFFLRLLFQLESTGKPLFSESSLRDEFAFVLSGLLNALYATTEHLKPVAGVAAVQGFKKSHPLIFDPKKGLRNLTVHERHVSPALAAYVAPRGNAVDLVFREPAGESTNLAFRSEYYVEAGGDPVHITKLCEQQYATLCEFSLRFGVAPDA